MVKPKLLVVACHLDRDPVDLEYELESMFRNSAEVYLVTMDNIPPNGQVDVIKGLLNIGGYFGVYTHQKLAEGIQKEGAPRDGYIPVCDLYAGIEQLANCVNEDIENGHRELGELGFGIAQRARIPAILLPKYDLVALANFVRG